MFLGLSLNKRKYMGNLYPKWLYKDLEEVIIYSEEEESKYSKEWMNNPNREFNTRVVKQKRGVVKDEK